MYSNGDHYLFFSFLKNWNSSVFLKFCIWITILFVLFASYEIHEKKAIKKYIKIKKYKYICMASLPINKCTFSREGVKFVAFKNGELVHGVACENFIKLKDKYDG